MSTYLNCWIREDQILRALAEKVAFLEGTSIKTLHVFVYFPEEDSFKPALLTDSVGALGSGEAPGLSIHFRENDEESSLTEAALEVEYDFGAELWVPSERTGELTYFWVPNSDLPLFPYDIPVGLLGEVHTSGIQTAHVSETLPGTIPPLRDLSEGVPPLMEISAIPPLVEISTVPPLIEISLAATPAEGVGHQETVVFDGDLGEPKWRCQCDACTDTTPF